MEKETRLINVMMSEQLIKRVDDFRFKNRCNSRAEAMRFLMEWALEHGAKKGRRTKNV